MITPIRPVFLRNQLGLWWLPPLVGIFIVIALAYALSVQYGVIQPWSSPPAAPSIQEHRSADGKVICYSFGSSLSCLPTWSLDAPNSWVVTYTPPKSRAKR